MKQTTITQQQALEILIKAVGLAQQKGAFTLQEASIIASAVETFTQTKEEDIDVEAVHEQTDKKSKK